MPSIIFTVALAVAGILEATSAIHDAMHKGDSACAAADYLKKLATQAEDKLKNQLARAQSDLSTATRMSIANKAQATSTRLGTALIAQIINFEAQKALSAALAAYPDIITGVGAVRQLQGVQELISEVEKLNLPDIEAEATGTWLGLTGVHLKPNLNPAATGECTTGANQRQPEERLAAPATPATRLLIFTIATKPAGTRLTDDLTVCEATRMGAFPTAACQAWTDATNLGFKGGKLLTAQQKTITQAGGDTSEYTTSSITSKELPTQEKLNELTKKIKAMELAAATLTYTPLMANLETTTPSENLKQAVARALKGEQGAYSAGKGKEETDKLLEQEYSENKKKVKEGIAKPSREFNPS
uniref:Variant surface glycoprotein 1584 n=1 Tax=Trypanosoma brucei TaxID=5691 RepID=M4SYT2_9TRYP|nr:variant surface glycoprotein 1584 [Trypanosoma brucei]